MALKNKKPKNKLSISWDEIMKYPGEWVNYYDGKILSHDVSLRKANEIADQKLKHNRYSGLFVKPEWGRVICLPIYFRTVDIHPWKPLFEVELGKSKST